MTNNISVKDIILNNRSYFEDIVSRFVYHSNGIEGSTLSLPDTYAIIFNDNSMKIIAEPREIYEAINLKYAIDYVFNKADDTKLIESDIININEIINKNIKNTKGYRNIPIYIRNTEYVPPEPKHVIPKMQYFIYNYNNTTYSDIYEKIAINHIEFERIHPFEDGNGRTGRLLIFKEMINNNIFPAVITKENRSEYLSYFDKQDAKSLANLIKESSRLELERSKLVLKKTQNNNLEQ